MFGEQSPGSAQEIACPDTAGRPALQAVEARLACGGIDRWLGIGSTGLGDRLRPLCKGRGA